MFRRWMDHLNPIMGGPVSSWLPGLSLVVVCSLALIGAVGMMTFRAASSDCAGANPLASYRWAHRPVVAFAPRADDRLERQVAAMVEDAASLSERDIALLTVTGPRSLAVPFGTAPPLRPKLNLTLQPGGIQGFADIAIRLRQCFGVARDDFAVILVGLDGSEKARWSEPVDPVEIFALIDVMPMRLRELGEGGN